MCAVCECLQCGCGFGRSGSMQLYMNQLNLDLVLPELLEKIQPPGWAPKHMSLRETNLVSITAVASLQ